MNAMPDVQIGGHAEEVPHVSALTYRVASEVQTRRVCYLWEGRIPLGAMTIMPGEEGIGKTTVGIRIMADLTRGALSGEYLGEPRTVVVVAPEDGVEDVLRPRFEQAGADLDRVLFVDGVFDPTDTTDRGVVLPRDLDALGRLVREKDVAMVWIDSLVTTLPGNASTTRYQDTSNALKPIGRWADTERVAVVAPWHLNKSAGSDTGSRMMDSKAFRSATRSVLMVFAADDAAPGVTEGFVVLDKVNASTLHLPALRYRLRSADYVVIENGREVRASCGVADWIGEVEGDARAIARAALSPKAERAETESVKWLREFLQTEGETDRQTVLRAAKEEMGYSERQLSRAATSLDVSKRTETGQHPENGSPWRKAIWSLPEGTG